MEVLLKVIIAISGIIIIGATMMMEPKQQGLGGSYGQDSNVFGKSTSKSKELLLQKATIAAAVVFMISVIVLVVIG